MAYDDGLEHVIEVEENSIVHRHICDSLKMNFAVEGKEMAASDSRGMGMRLGCDGAEKWEENERLNRTFEVGLDGEI